jgi:hypothetical protein
VDGADEGMPRELRPSASAQVRRDNMCRMRGQGSDAQGSLRLCAGRRGPNDAQFRVFWRLGIWNARDEPRWHMASLISAARSAAYADRQIQAQNWAVLSHRRLTSCCWRADFQAANCDGRLPALPVARGTRRQPLRHGIPGRPVVQLGAAPGSGGHPLSVCLSVCLSVQLGAAPGAGGHPLSVCLSVCLSNLEPPLEQVGPAAGIASSSHSHWPARSGF